MVFCPLTPLCQQTLGAIMSCSVTTIWCTLCPDMIIIIIKSLGGWLAAGDSMFEVWAQVMPRWTCVWKCRDFGSIWWLLHTCLAAQESQFPLYFLCVSTSPLFLELMEIIALPIKIVWSLIWHECLWIKLFCPSTQSLIWNFPTCSSGPVYPATY